MSDLYYLVIDVLDMILQFIWAVILCLSYRHFFQLKLREPTVPALAGKLFSFLPGVLWLAVKRVVDTAVPVTLMPPADSVKGLYKLFLIYGGLLLISFLFYEGSRRQLTLITIMSAAVSEIGRFLSFSGSVFWNRLYDVCNRWFERNYPNITAEKYLSLLERLGMLQQVSYAVIFVAVIYGTFRYVRRVFKSRELPLHRTEYLFLMFPCASSFLLCSLLRTIMFTAVEDTVPKTFFESYPLLIIIVPLLLILCLFSILYSIKLYQEMLTLNEERGRRAVLEKQVVSMEEHARELERLYCGVRSMKHDMKNQLAVLGNLVMRQDGGEELPGYLEQLNRTLGKLDMPFQTGSTVVDSLLSMKYHEACEKLPGIRFEARDLIFPKECRIQPADLCVILGNALDNAIEACQRLREESAQEECHIRLYSCYRQEMFLLTVENSFSGKLRVGRGSAFPSTTKPDSEAHGIGMHNIKAAAERYRGGVSWNAEKGEFTLTVMLGNGAPPDSFL